jgi:hypothetical protein
MLFFCLGILAIGNLIIVPVAILPVKTANYEVP